MFTGLIEETGTLSGIEDAGNGAYLTIYAHTVTGDLNTGDSVSIDGACQTVTRFTRDSFTVFASKVTLEVTTLGDFRPGRKVNLERAMSASARFGGHFVQGHVDCRGRIESAARDENGVRFKISVPAEIAKYIVAKGSVAVDGISLTVVSLTENGFEIYLIPETIKNTTLFEKKQGDEVNIETDIIARYIERMMKAGEENSGTDESGLKRALMEGGFI